MENDPVKSLLTDAEQEVKGYLSKKIRGKAIIEINISEGGIGKSTIELQLKKDLKHVSK